MNDSPLFELRNANKIYGSKVLSHRVTKVFALQDIDLKIFPEDKVAIVGESGSGKSTLLRILLGLTTLTSGAYLFAGEPVNNKNKKILHSLRANTGVIMQDPGASFNPMLVLEKSILEPYQATDGRSKAQKLCADLGLPADTLHRYPHEFSGGQRQRLAIVRALINNPSILIADEPTSALDTLATSQLLDTLARATSERKLTQLTVAHDLALVPRIASKVFVLQQGRLIESGSVSAVFGDPQTNYTKKLLHAAGV